MPIINGFSNNELREDPRNLMDFAPGTSDVIKQTFVESLVRSPTASIGRIRAQGFARTGQVRFQSLGGDQVVTHPIDVGRKIPQEEANFLGKPFGLTFTKDVNQAELDLLIDRKKKELTRNLVINRASGFGQKSAALTVGLLSTALDPLNIAAGFLPVPIVEARLAALTGRFGSRLIKGGAEGLVGGVVAEGPIIIASNQEQADYDLNNSVMNLTFGALFGAGIHSVGGRIKDIKTNRKFKRTLDELEIISRGVDEELDSLKSPRTEGERLAAHSEATQQEVFRAVAAQVDEGIVADGSPILDAAEGRRPVKEVAEELIGDVQDFRKGVEYDEAEYTAFKERQDIPPMDTTTQESALEVEVEANEAVEDALEDFRESQSKVVEDKLVDHIDQKVADDLQQIAGVNSEGTLRELAEITVRTEELKKLTENKKALRDFVKCVSLGLI